MMVAFQLHMVSGGAGGILCVLVCWAEPWHIPPVPWKCQEPWDLVTSGREKPEAMQFIMQWLCA